MSKYNIRDHKDEIITHVIKNLVWIPIAASMPIIYHIAQMLLIQYSNMNNYTIILAIISLIISIISIVLTIYQYRKNNYSKSQENDICENKNCIVPINNFRITSVDCELCFENIERNDITSTLSYDMIANSDGIEYFEKELIWTGETYINTDLIESNGNYKLELFDSNNSIHKYRIYFSEPLKCQDRVTFKLVTKVSDSNLSMQPINSYTVKHQIDNLIIRVVAPPNCIKNVKRSMYADMTRQLPIGESTNIQKKTIARKECYETTFPTPTISHRCFVEWEFTKS